MPSRHRNRRRTYTSDRGATSSRPWTRPRYRFDANFLRRLDSVLSRRHARRSSDRVPYRLPVYGYDPREVYDPPQYDVPLRSTHTLRNFVSSLSRRGRHVWDEIEISDDDIPDTAGHGPGYDSDETLPWHEDFEHEGQIHRSTVDLTGDNFRDAVLARDTHEPTVAAGGGGGGGRYTISTEHPSPSEYRALNAMRSNRLSGPGPTGSGGPLSAETRAGLARRPNESLQAWLERNGLPSSFPRS